MNVPMYLLALHVLGPCFTTPFIHEHLAQSREKNFVTKFIRKTQIKVALTKQYCCIIKTQQLKNFLYTVLMCSWL